MSNAITISVLGDTRNLVSGVGNASGKLSSLGRTAGKAGKAIAKGLAFGAAGAAAAAAAFIGASIKSLGRIERIGAQTESVIKSTGGAAGVTRDHIDSLAGSLENLTATEAESITEGANMLLTFTGIRNGVGKSNQIFDQAVGAITDMSRALDKTGGANIDTTKTAVQLGKALNDPIKGITALSKVGVSFTTVQKDQIKSLVDSGQTMKAQKIILAELNKEFGGSAKAFGSTTVGKIELAKHALGTLGESLTSNILPALGKLATAATKGLAWLDTKAPAIRAFVGDLIDRIKPAIAGVGAFLLDFGKIALSAVKTVGQAFADLAQKLSPVTDFLRDNPVVLKGAAIALGIAAVATLGLAAAMGILAIASSPVTLTILAIAAVGGALALAYQKSETFRTAIDKVGAFLRDEVVPALREFGDYLVSTVVPAVVKLAQSVGAKLQPVITAAGAFIQGSLIPTLRKVVAKFEEWRPAIQRTVITVAKIIGRLIEFAATVAGKVLPPLIRFAGFMLRNVAPAILSVIGFIGRIIGRAVAFGAAFIDTIRDLAKWVTGVTNKGKEVLDYVRGIPGKVTSALGDLGGLLRQAGIDLIQGFINGIGDMFGSVQNKLGELTGKLTSWKGPPKKDRVLLRGAGRMLIQGLIRGFGDEYRNVEKRLGKLTKLIGAFFDKKFKDSKKAKAAATATVKALTSELKSFDRILEAYQKAKKARADYYTSVRDNALSFADITGVGQVGENGEQTATSIVQGLRDRLNAITNFRAKLARLTRLGLSKDLLDDIISKGVDGGTATAEALVAGGSAAVKAANALQSQIRTAAKGLGTTATDAVLAPLDRTKVIKAAKDAANTIASVLRKRLRLRVDVAGLGTNPGNAARTEVRTAIDVPRTRVNPDSLHSRTRTRPEDRTVRIHLTAEQVSQLERGKRVTADLRYYQRNGGTKP